MISNIIGSFDWDSCENCIHSEATGNCDLNDLDFQEGLQFVYDTIYCTNYEEMEEMIDE